MEPTARARALAVPLRQALAELGALVDPPGTFDPKTARRTFRISGGDYAGMTVLPALIEDLQRGAPGIDIRFRYVEKDALPPLLDRDELDLGIAVVGDLPPRFRCEPLIEETFVCAVRAGHPILDAPLTPERFANADHLLVTERADEHGCMDELLERGGLVRRIALTVPSAALVAGVLAHSDLIATIPRRAGEHIAEDGAITLVAPPYDAGAWTMSLIWADRNTHDPGLLWLRERIHQAVARKRAVENGSTVEGGTYS
jgi:DNA-binding transcriptional LysR family regulator